jgi:hypothetical protein
VPHHCTSVDQMTLFCRRTFWVRCEFHFTVLRLGLMDVLLLQGEVLLLPACTLHPFVVVLDMFVGASLLAWDELHM